MKKGDIIELNIPMQPRIITADQQVNELKGKAAIGLGPVIYCLEEVDNADIENLKLNTNQQFSSSYDKNLLNGVNIISGKGLNNNGSPISIKAVPYYAAGNRTKGAYKVWIPIAK
ncbi:hypothetical protein [Niabella ginsengisoli]|uniref:hypothetical protein n=1 Tax=Niabella ginsengisoli TaxID=522298 RepID=UPI00374D0FF4